MKGKGNSMDENVKVWNPGRHERRTERRGLDVKRFARQNRDIVRNVVIMVATVLVACLLTGWRTTVKLRSEFEDQLRAERFRVEQEVASRMRAEYGVDEAEAQALAMQEEAMTLAKMLYPMRNNTDLGLKSACWCAINRVDSQWYPNTIDEVCAQDRQWMGWSEDNPVVERLYNIALEALIQWHKGIHAVGADYLFLDWNTKEITLRTTFEGGRGCHYWYEEDWEKENK